MEPHFRHVSALPDNLGCDLVAIDAPSDGSCLFHSALNAMWIPYRKLEDPADRRAMALHFRERLACYLEERGDATGATVYDTLMGGRLAAFVAESGLREHTLDSMKRSLRSGMSVGYEMVEVLSRYLGFSIHVMWLADGALQPYPSGYNFGMESFWRREGRRSIVVLYTPASADSEGAGHYETIARDKRRHHYQTVFDGEDPFIVALRGLITKRETLALQEETAAPRVFLGGREVRKGEWVNQSPEPRGEMFRVALSPGRLLESVAMLRDGELVFLSINIKEAHFSRGDVVVPLPRTLGEGEYVVEVYDQGEYELEKPSAEELGGAWLRSLAESFPLVGRVTFGILS